jgi:hypothetical protein
MAGLSVVGFVVTGSIPYVWLEFFGFNGANQIGSPSLISSSMLPYMAMRSASSSMASSLLINTFPSTGFLLSWPFFEFGFPVSTW